MLCARKRLFPSIQKDLHTNRRSSDRRAGLSTSLQMNHLRPLPQVYVCRCCDGWGLAAQRCVFCSWWEGLENAKNPRLGEFVRDADMPCWQFLPLCGHHVDRAGMGHHVHVHARFRNASSCFHIIAAPIAARAPGSHFVCGCSIVDGHLKVCESCRCCEPMAIHLMQCVTVQSHPVMMMAGVFSTAKAYALQPLAALSQSGVTVKKRLPTPCRRRAHQARPYLWCLCGSKRWAPTFQLYMRRLHLK
jgi:hypothetical protein